jgi:hypothetical protein
MNYKYSLDIVKELALQNNCECLSISYKQCKQLLRFKCNECSSEWHRSIEKAVHRNRWCTKCQVKNNRIIKQQKILLQIKEIASKFNVEVISIKYETGSDLLIWKCHKGHIFKRSFEKSKRSDFHCDQCRKEKDPPNKLTINACHEDAAKLGGKCLSTEYYGLEYRYDWQCNNGHIFRALANNVRRGYWCPKCMYKTQEKVRDIFERLFDVRFDTKRFSWLKNDKTDHFLELDGYNEEVNIAFEYDGEYHFRPHFKNKRYDLVARRYCDELKTKLCKENNVTLIRIPYTEKSRLEKFINLKLLEAGISPISPS